MKMEAQEKDTNIHPIHIHTQSTHTYTLTLHTKHIIVKRQHKTHAARCKKKYPTKPRAREKERESEKGMRARRHGDKKSERDKVRKRAGRVHVASGVYVGGKKQPGKEKKESKTTHHKNSYSNYVKFCKNFQQWRNIIKSSPLPSPSFGCIYAYVYTCTTAPPYSTYYTPCVHC